MGRELRPLGGGARAETPHPHRNAVLPIFSRAVQINFISGHYLVLQQTDLYTDPKRNKLPIKSKPQAVMVTSGNATSVQPKHIIIEARMYDDGVTFRCIFGINKGVITNRLAASPALDPWLLSSLLSNLAPRALLFMPKPSDIDPKCGSCDISIKVTVR